MLWELDPADFVAHCLDGAEPAVLAASPVLLTADPQGCPHRDVLVNLAPQLPAGYHEFARVIEIVGNADEDERALARQRWRAICGGRACHRALGCRGAAGRAMNSPPRVPPRFVPTLTQVVHAPPAPAAAPLPGAAPVPAAPHGTAGEFEEYVVHRVMQRVDLVLEQRLRQAIAQVTEEQTRSLGPRLREEVESVVRHAVYEAVAQELAQERPAP